MSPALPTELLAFNVSELEFFSTTSVKLRPKQLLLIIGPNNAGKSTLLRTLKHSLPDAKARGPILSLVNTQKVGSQHAVNEWITSEQPPELERSEMEFIGPGGKVTRAEVQSWITPRLSVALVRQFTNYVTYKSRMKAVLPSPAFDPLCGKPEHPIHVLLSNPQTHQVVNRLVNEAFGMKILVDQGAGLECHCYCVPRDENPPSSDRVSLEYLRWLRQHPRLDEQGDGLQSYVGCIVECLSRKAFITLLDEPEVFLHPPQARLLGRTLAQTVASSQQLIVATHSADLLRGVFDSGQSTVSVVRLQRDEKGGGIATSISQEKIASLWKNQALKYSNLLDALFHRYAIVCEADSDCKFYQWLFEGEQTDIEDIMFIPAGGKTHIPSIMEALRGLGVPSRAILDADLLRDKQNFQSLVRSCAGDWSEFENDWQLVSNAVSSTGTAKTKDEFGRNIKALIDKHQSKYVNEDLVDRIRSEAKVETGWAHIKSSGFSALPNGPPAAAWMRMCDKLSRLGIFVVPVGELEGFVRSERGHGPGWLVNVQLNHTADSPQLAAAREFVGTVLAQLGPRSSADPTTASNRHERTSTRSDKIWRGVREMIYRIWDNTVVKYGFVIFLLLMAFVWGVTMGMSAQRKLDLEQRVPPKPTASVSAGVQSPPVQ